MSIAIHPLFKGPNYLCIDTNAVKIENDTIGGRDHGTVADLQILARLDGRGGLESEFPRLSIFDMQINPPWKG